MFNYVTNEEFDLLKQHWEKLCKSNPTSSIFPTCVKLAETHDIIPLRFISGYTDIKDKLKKKPTVKTMQTRYILFAVKEGHTQFFKGFEKWKNTLDYDNTFKLNPCLSTGSISGQPYAKELDRKFINYWLIEYRYKLCTNYFDASTLIDPPWIEREWSDMIEMILNTN